MTTHRSTLERIARRVPVPATGYERLLQRRDRRRRDRRVVAGISGLAVFAVAIWSVTAGLHIGSGGRPTVADGGTATSRPASAVGPVPTRDYLLDLDTGSMTPLPVTIGDDEQRGNGYAASPDGSRLAYVERGDNGNAQVFVASLDGTGIEQVSHDVDAASAPTWSPDGSKIAYTGHHDRGLRDVFVSYLTTGASTQLTFGTNEPDPAAPSYGPWHADSPHFTSDGSSIVYTATRGDSSGDQGEAELRMVAATGGDSVPLLAGLDMAQLSPDGTRIAFSSAANPDGPCVGSSPAALCVANIDGTDVDVLVRGGTDAISVNGWSPDGTRIACSEFHLEAVSIVDVDSGRTWTVAEGDGASWLDDHTIIVERDHCSFLPSGSAGGSSDGCLG